MSQTQNRFPSFKEAIIQLLDARGWKDETWATLLGCDEQVIADFRRMSLDDVYPNDTQMTRILRELERIQGSQSGVLAVDALECFWSVVEAWEQQQGLPEWLARDLLPDESVSQRFTRWTNDAWITNLTRNIHLIPPRRRREFVIELFGVFNKYTTD